jgi:hypothetical protein
MAGALSREGSPGAALRALLRAVRAAPLAADVWRAAPGVMARAMGSGRAPVLR